MRITLILAVILSLAVFLSSCNFAFAQDEIGYSRIDPTSYFYFLKTVREGLELKFAQTHRIKMARYLEFSQRRIREVNSLIKNGHPDLVTPTLERYWIHLTDLNSHLVMDISLTKEMMSQLKMQTEDLEKVYNQTPDPRAKMAIRTTVNRLAQWNIQLWGRINSDFKPLLSNQFLTNQSLSCNFLSKEALSSSLNEVERLVLSQRAQKCATSFFK